VEVPESASCSGDAGDLEDGGEATVSVVISGESDDGSSDSGILGGWLTNAECVSGVIGGEGDLRASAGIEARLARPATDVVDWDAWDMDWGRKECVEAGGSAPR